MLSAVLKALAAIPDLVSLLREVFSFVKSLTKDKPHEKLVETRDTFREVRKATNAKAKQRAANKLGDLIKRL